MHGGVIGYSIDDIKGISPSFCMHSVLVDDRHQPSRQPQCHLNPNMELVVKKWVIKVLDTGIIYPISDSDCVRSL